MFLNYFVIKIIFKIINFFNVGFSFSLYTTVEKDYNESQVKTNYFNETLWETKVQP